MVKIIKPYEQMADLEENPTFFGSIHTDSHLMASQPTTPPRKWLYLKGNQLLLEEG